ncbi:hypothetical protein ES703_110472 [subsurface metagenome]
MSKYHLNGLFLLIYSILLAEILYYGEMNKLIHMFCKHNIYHLYAIVIKEEED